MVCGAGTLPACRLTYSSLQNRTNLNKENPHMRLVTILATLLAAWLPLSGATPAAETKGLTPVQQDAVHTLDGLRPELVTVNQEIWNFAELGLEEYRSSARLAGLLKKAGFKVRE